MPRVLIGDNLYFVNFKDWKLINCNDFMHLTLVRNVNPIQWVSDVHLSIRDSNTLERLYQTYLET